MKWYSLHVFYYDNQDNILVNCISPLLKKYKISKFFFIRYWENGPHIRLRIFLDDENIIIKLKEQIQKFINKNPSSLHINIYLYEEKMKTLYLKEKSVYRKLNIYDNNTIKYFDYIPELEKYFGINGVKIAEKEFIFSSKLALYFLSFNISKIKKYIISSIFFNQVLKSFNKSKADRKLFLENYILFWSKFSEMKYDRKFLEKIGNINLSKNDYDNLYKIMEIKRNIIVHETIYTNINDYFGLNVKYTDRFLFNFLHLFNNRLGLEPKDEIIVAELVKGS